MTLLTACYWHHSVRNWKLFCFLYHFDDCICSGLWSFYLGHFKNFFCMFACMYVCNTKRVYFKRGVSPKCEVQMSQCGIQNGKMWIATFDIIFTVWLLTSVPWMWEGNDPQMTFPQQRDCWKSHLKAIFATLLSTSCGTKLCHGVLIRYFRFLVMTS